MITKIGWTALAVVIAASFTAGCVDRQAQEQGKATQKVVMDTAIAVSVESAQRRDVPIQLDLTGTLKTSGDVQVSAKASGRISAIYVHEGDTVQRGQLIARLEGMEAESRLSQAEASAAASKAQLDSALTDAKAAPLRTSAAVRAAQFRVAAANDQLNKLRNGGRSAERIQAQTNVTRAKSDLDYADKQLARTKGLYEQGALALTDLEAAQNRRDQAAAAYQNTVQQLSLTVDSARPEDISAAQAQVRQAEEDLKTAQANKALDPQFQQRIDVARANYRSSLDQVRLASQAITDLRVTSPTSGKVTGSPLQSGTVVSPGLAIARIVNLEGVYYDAEVGESNVAKIKEGQPVKVKVEALPNLVLNGHVQGVESIGSSVGRLFNARVELDEKPSGLKAGMFARGQAELGVDVGAVTVSSSALLAEGDKTFVFVAGTDNKAHKKQVMVKSTLGTSSAVTGISAGDQIVIHGQSSLVEGAVVKVQTTPAAGV